MNGHRRSKGSNGWRRVSLDALGLHSCRAIFPGTGAQETMDFELEGVNGHQQVLKQWAFFRK